MVNQASEDKGIQDRISPKIHSLFLIFNDYRLRACEENQLKLRNIFKKERKQTIIL